MIALCVPWRSTPDRAAAWGVVRRHYGSRWPIITADSGHQPFNRAASRNRAADLAITAGADVLVLHDADMTVAHKAIDEAAQLAREQRRMVIPYTELDCLTTDGTTWLHTEDSVGGIVVVTAEDFIAVGRYDEGYVGWGFEDTDFHARCATMLGPALRLDHPATHHPHVNEYIPGSDTYEANRARHAERWG